MKYFATYFDSNYLAKALVELDSLKRHEKSFIWFAYCFDEFSYRTLKELNLSGVAPIALWEFETEEIKATKVNKKKYYEYYWTYTPQIILNTLNRIDENDLVTYLDADLMFFDSTDVLYEELGDDDLLLQPNNFSVNHVAQYEPIGYYCVDYLTVRNNKNGREVMYDWLSDNIDWCLSTPQKGKFGDQKYLEGWMGKYPKVREIINQGASVSPWNVDKYAISKQHDKLYVNNIPLIFYHYHSFKMNLDDFAYIVTGDRHNKYDITETVIENLYTPYINELKRVIAKLKRNNEFSKYIAINPKSGVRMINNPDDEYQQRISENILEIRS